MTHLHAERTRLPDSHIYSLDTFFSCSTHYFFENRTQHPNRQPYRVTQSDLCSQCTAKQFHHVSCLEQSCSIALNMEQDNIEMNHHVFWRESRDDDRARSDRTRAERKTQSHKRREEEKRKLQNKRTIKSRINRLMSFYEDWIEVQHRENVSRMMGIHSSSPRHLHEEL